MHPAQSKGLYGSSNINCGPCEGILDADVSPTTHVGDIFNHAGAGVGAGVGVASDSGSALMAAYFGSALASDTSGRACPVAACGAFRA